MRPADHRRPGHRGVEECGALASGAACSIILPKLTWSASPYRKGAPQREERKGQHRGTAEMQQAAVAASGFTRPAVNYSLQPNGIIC